MKKFAAIALSVSLFSTAASAVVIDVNLGGVVQRINCGATQASLTGAALSEVQKGFCRQVFEQAAQAGAGGAGGTGAGAAGAGAGGAGAAAGAFGLGAGGAAALALLGILVVAGLGGASNTTTGSN